MLIIYCRIGVYCVMLFTRMFIGLVCFGIFEPVMYIHSHTHTHKEKEQNQAAQTISTNVEKIPNMLDCNCFLMFVFSNLPLDFTRHH